MGELESIEDVLRDRLADHLYDGCTEPACDPGSDPEVCVGRPFLNHLVREAADAIRAHLADVAGWDEVRGKVIESLLLDHMDGDYLLGEHGHTLRHGGEDRVAISQAGPSCVARWAADAAVGAYLQAIGDDK